MGVLRSMTGFGAASVEVAGGRLTVSLRAVNHRFLDVRLRLPEPLQSLAPAAERALRRLQRGRVELQVVLEGEAAEAVRLRGERARSALAQLRALRDEVAPGEPLPLSLLAVVPELFEAGPGLEGEHWEDALLRAVEGACEQLEAMRRREGEALEADLRSRLRRARELVGALAAEAPAVAGRLAERLRARLQRLLPEGLALDPGRLEQEVALLAERADVSEELTRLSSHIDQFERLLGEAREPVGRRLDFLLQEMAREANTAGVKCADAGMQHVVVELKAEVERLREQVQNVL